MRRGNWTGRSLYPGFQGSLRNILAVHGSKILLLWLPGHKDPSGMVQLFRASE